MSDAEPKTEIELPDDQAQGLRQMSEWAKAANAELGVAYLRFEETRRAFEVAEKHLRACAQTANESNKQYQDMLANVADASNLPDGEWVYDGKKKLTRKK